MRLDDFLAESLRGATAEAVGRSFFAATEPLGLRAIYARATRPAGVAKEITYSRISPPGWESFYAEQRFADVNYLNREIGRRVGPFRWSEIKLRDRREIALANALIDNGFPDGLAVPVHGPSGYTGVVSLAFADLDAISPGERQAIELAAFAVHNRMHALSEPQGKSVALSVREADCLAYIARGLSDPAIAEKLGISLSTVVTHVQNARLKLDAKTRAQAVAIALSLRLL